MKEKTNIKNDDEGCPKCGSNILQCECEGWTWRDVLALGLAIMFVCLGLGGCVFLVDVGAGIRESKTTPLELPK